MAKQHEAQQEHKAPGNTYVQFKNIQDQVIAIRSSLSTIEGNLIDYIDKHHELLEKETKENNQHD